jgi:DNA invertase Pin-like site-specific DNA recombinase
MADIEAGKVHIVVVYKIDRLSRSLADFARMVETFDRCKVSFSAVTQQINSATSMGRLMLNVLLSFAQFEREVTGERIRDKIAASKAKGMWMGGPLPLGYDVLNRLLVINETEAATVRRIFDGLVLERTTGCTWARSTTRARTTPVPTCPSSPNNNGLRLMRCWIPTGVNAGVIPRPRMHRHRCCAA